jgi:hypothetical protein
MSIIALFINRTCPNIDAKPASVGNQGIARHLDAVRRSTRKCHCVAGASAVFYGSGNSTSAAANVVKCVAYRADSQANAKEDQVGRGSDI